MDISILIDTIMVVQKWSNYTNFNVNGPNLGQGSNSVEVFQDVKILTEETEKIKHRIKLSSYWNIIECYILKTSQILSVVD